MRKLLLLLISADWEDLEKKRKLQRRRGDSRVKKRRGHTSSVTADCEVTAVMAA